MINLGISTKVMDYNAALFGEQFLLNKDEAEKMQEVLDSNPKNLAVEFNSRENLAVSGFVPGTAPLDFLADLDIDAKGSLRREGERNWEVEYQLGKKDAKHCDYSPGTLFVYPKIEFEFKHLDDVGGIIKTESSVSFFLIPSDRPKDKARDRFEWPFIHLFEQYFSRSGKARSRTSDFVVCPRQFLYSLKGINFAPLTQLKEVAGHVEHVTSNISYQELEELAGLEEFGRRNATMSFHSYISPETKQLVINALGRGYENRVSEIADRILYTERAPSKLLRALTKRDVVTAA